MPPESCSRKFVAVIAEADNFARSRSTSAGARRAACRVASSASETLPAAVRHGSSACCSPGTRSRFRGRGPRSARRSKRDLAAGRCGSGPPTMRSSVVLPQPDGPTRQTNSPLATVRLMSSRIGRPPSERLTFSNSITGAAGATTARTSWSQGSSSASLTMSPPRFQLYRARCRSCRAVDRFDLVESESGVRCCVLGRIFYGKPGSTPIKSGAGFSGKCLPNMTPCGGRHGSRRFRLAGQK